MIDVGELSDVVFAKDDFKEVHLRIDGTWLDLFQLLAALFSQGCTRATRDACTRRVTFHDLLYVKERMRQCQVICGIERVVFPHEPQPSFPETVFRVIPGPDMTSSKIEVLGDAVYVVTFIPTPCPIPTARGMCGAC